MTERCGPCGWPQDGSAVRFHAVRRRTPASRGYKEVRAHLAAEASERRPDLSSFVSRPPDRSLATFGSPVRTSIGGRRSRTRGGLLPRPIGDEASRSPAVIGASSVRLKRFRSVSGIWNPAQFSPLNFGGRSGSKSCASGRIRGGDASPALPSSRGIEPRRAEDPKGFVGPLLSETFRPFRGGPAGVRRARVIVGMLGDGRTTEAPSPRRPSAAAIPSWARREVGAELSVTTRANLSSVRAWRIGTGWSPTKLS